MTRRIVREWRYMASLLTGMAICSPLAAATPSVEDALRLKPVQNDAVEYDVPPAGDVAKCVIKPEKWDKMSGWTVSSPSGALLRSFVDTNNDKYVDRWGYYHDGIEVYRDIDSDFNGKVDQHRWLNTAGSRWGHSPDRGMAYASESIRDAMMKSLLCTPGSALCQTHSAISSRMRSALKVSATRVGSVIQRVE